MIALPRPSFGGPLTETDYRGLRGSWITEELADQALLRRVTSSEGATVTGRHDNGKYSGIIFPYVWPGEDHCREYWLRRDQPEVEYNSQGQLREKNKYLGPPGRGNLLYIVPGISPMLLSDISIPVAITEGAKKTIALYRLSRHELPEDAAPRFLPVGLAGVWSFRGRIGKAEGPDGQRRDETGLITDIRRLDWKGRQVFVVYDANVGTNDSVAAARRVLTQELRQLGSRVLWVNLPGAGAHD